MTNSAYYWPTAIELSYPGDDWNVKNNTIDYCTYGVYISNPQSGGAIRENKIENFVEGIRTSSTGSYNVVIEKNKLNGYNSANYGIHAVNGGTDIDIIFNWIYKCNRGISTTLACEIRSNSIWDCDIGIEDQHNTNETMYVYENTVQRCTGTYGYGLYKEWGKPTEIKNNIFTTVTYGIYGNATNADADYNCYYSYTYEYNDNDFGDGHDLDNTNPKFVGLPFSYDWDEDFRYFLKQTAAGQAETSPCVNSGNGRTPYGTTRTDEVADSGVLDVGAHLP